MAKQNFTPPQAIQEIGPREMNRDELIAILDKMSENRTQGVPLNRVLNFPGFETEYGDWPTVKEFHFLPAHNSYFACLEEGNVRVDISRIDNFSISSAIKELNIQRLSDKIGLNKEYVLEEPMRVKLNDEAEGIIDAIKISDESDYPSFTYKGKYIDSDGKEYDESFDPDTQEAIDNSVISDICSSIVDGGQKESLNNTQTTSLDENDPYQKLVNIAKKYAETLIRDIDKAETEKLQQAFKECCISDENYIQLNGFEKVNYRNKLRAEIRDIAKAHLETIHEYGNDPKYYSLLVYTPLDDRHTHPDKWDISSSPAIKESQPASSNTGGEKLLHDNFEKLMKEQEKQERSQGLKM